MPHNDKKRPSEITLSKTARFYCFVALCTFLVGASPVMFNLLVDPYEMNKFVDFGLAKKKISEKSHYPLWKVTHYPEKTSNVVILGDSRARALSDKYWHELGLTDAYNFAYGGTTMFEIYDTFHHVKASRNLKSLVVGIQLRSFDFDHKYRMNRVPEAIRLSQNPMQYYSNWFVSGIGFKILNKQYGDNVKWLAEMSSGIFSSAYANDFAGDSHKELQDLLEPLVCDDCTLPTNILPLMHPSAALTTDYYFTTELGIWRNLWAPITIDRNLPRKFNRQIITNAKSDWRSFDFSEEFWSYLVEISRWCQQHDIKLIFVIPPTIVEMQGRIVEFGHGELNHIFRQRLAKLGLVVDFDFDTPLTRDLDRFTDAYHFNSRTSKLIVGEIAQLVTNDREVIALARKRRGDIICPLTFLDISQKTFDKTLEVLEGKSCRIWRTRQ